MIRTGTYCEPSPDILMWDTYTAEAAVTAQLLHMYGLLPDTSPATLEAVDARTGRQPGQMDLTGGSVRILLEEGFHLRHVSADDFHRLATDGDYLRRLLLEEGETPAHLDEVLPTWTPQVQARAAARLRLYEQYADQVELVREPSSWQWVDRLLDAGYHVVVNLVSDDGTGHNVLVVRRLDAGTHLVFDPHEVGVVEGNIVGAPLAYGIAGYRFPGGAA